MDTKFKRTIWRYDRVNKSLHELEWTYPLTKGFILWRSCRCVELPLKGALPKGGWKKLKQKGSGTLVTRSEKLGVPMYMENERDLKKRKKQCGNPKYEYKLTSGLSCALNYACEEISRGLGPTIRQNAETQKSVTQLGDALECGSHWVGEEEDVWKVKRLRIPLRKWTHQNKVHEFEVIH